MRYRSFLAPALACLAGGASGSGEGEDGHPEYLALYSFGVGGGYLLQLGGGGSENLGEASVEFMVVPSSSADHEGLEEAEEVSIPGEQRWLRGCLFELALDDWTGIWLSTPVVSTAGLWVVT